MSDRRITYLVRGAEGEEMVSDRTDLCGLGVSAVQTPLAHVLTSGVLGGLGDLGGSIDSATRTTEGHVSMTRALFDDRRPARMTMLRATDVMDVQPSRMTMTRRSPT